MTRVLFVCLGNICRSPAAEGILRQKAADAKIKILVDSAGTGGWHSGEPPDGRMIRHAMERGYDLSKLIARQFDIADFENFDLILTMDNSNFTDVRALDRSGRFSNKVRKTASFCRIHAIEEVPDPYSRDNEGFRLVLDILEDACSEIVETLKETRTP